MSNTETMTEDFASLFAESIATQDLAEQRHRDRHRERPRRHRRRPEDRRPRAAERIRRKAKDGDLKVGDEVEVYLERIENAMGEAVLSRDKARREESWVRLEVAFNAKSRPARSSTRSRAASPSIWTAPWPSCRAARSTSARSATSPADEHPQPFQILKMDKRRGNIVVSRRVVLEESRAEQRSELVQNLAEGQVIEGMVKNITDYGAFVDLGGIDGLLHVTDIAWRRVNHPSEVLSIGQTVKVQIIRINQETHRISLGMKQLEADPWEGIEAKYPAGKRKSPAA
jgi:small subunit ribosomal protein S1